MNLSTKSFVLFSVLFVVSVGIVLAGLKNGWFEATPVADNSTIPGNSNPVEPPRNSSSLSKALRVDEESMVEIGGIERPAHEVNFSDAKAPAKLPASPYKFPGKAKPLKGNENEMVSGLYKELKNEQGPIASKSARFKPQEFDKEAYERNPKEYLSKIRPGRVFHPANPGPDVTRLKPLSQRMNHILQTEKVVLKVQAEKSSPLTFYTPQNGVFDNQLSTYSVAADENGVATAVFHAVRGVNGINDILVASPLHSGQIQFTVRVSLPE